jgi:hypothetical protein
VYSFQKAGFCWLSGVCTSSEWRLVDGLPEEAESGHINVPPNWRRRKRRLSSMMGAVREFYRTSIVLNKDLRHLSPKDLLLLSNATDLGNARRFLDAGGFDVRGAIEALRKRFQRFYVGARI